MRLVSEYRSPKVAAELESLVVPVMLVGFPGSTRVAPGEFRTSTREASPAMPPLASALLDADARLLPLIKSGRNPYENFVFVGRSSTCDIILRDASVSKAHAVFEQGVEVAPARQRIAQRHVGQRQAARAEGARGAGEWRRRRLRGLPRVRDHARRATAYSGDDGSPGCLRSPKSRPPPPSPPPTGPSWASAIAWVVTSCSACSARGA